MGNLSWASFVWSVWCFPNIWCIGQEQVSLQHRPCSPSQ
jgi:hypothetical protein